MIATTTPQRARARVATAGALVALAVAIVAASAIGALRSAPWSVLMAIRIPRVALAVLVGATLACAGAGMQGLLRNPLADPGLLGVSSGAALGAVSTIVLGGLLPTTVAAALGPAILPVAAFGGALLATRVVMRLGRIDGRTSVAALLLAGVAVAALASAITGFLAFVATDAQLRTITFWSLGSLGGATWTLVAWAAPPMVLAIVLLLRSARVLDALALGEAEARHLGFAVERKKRAISILVALGVGSAVATSGVIGFVGLIVPHAVRLAIGPRHGPLIALSTIAGATLLVLADVLARTISAPAEVPIGIFTSCLGAPFFLGLVARDRSLLR